MKKYLLLIPFLLPFVVNSQDSDLGNWMVYNGNLSIDQRFTVNHAIHYRNYNMVGDLQQLLTRVGLGYNLSDSQSIMIGYDYFVNQPYVDEDEKRKINEHRIFQHFVTTGSIGPMLFKVRFRLAQRFIENQEVDLRGRAFIGMNLPLSNKDIIDNTFYLSSNIEFFREFANSEADFIWLYGGLGYNVHDGLQFELGYMNQFNASSPDRDQLQIIAFYNFSL